MSRSIQRIGLTGGIGSGKSTVAARLAALGAHVVDTDAISHALTQAGGAAIEPLRSVFGSVAIGADGALDRYWMRQRAFNDPTARAALEAILHPLIGQQAQEQAQMAPGSACTVFDVPLLVESGHWRRRVDRVVVVDCPVAVQLERVMHRPGWTREAAESVVAQQATRAQRRAAADAVIDNASNDLAALHRAVEALWNHWIVAN